MLLQFLTNILINIIYVLCEASLEWLSQFYCMLYK